MTKSELMVRLAEAICCEKNGNQLVAKDVEHTV
jgi:hypothetical protein